MRYRIQEGAFDLPDALHDQTVNIFTVAPAGPSSFNLVITRSEAQTVFPAQHAKIELDRLRQALTNFEYLWERQHLLGGRPAIIAASKTNGPNGPVEQRHIFCLLDNRKALTITATAADSFDTEHLDWLQGFAVNFVFEP